MPLTDKTTVLATYIQGLITTNKATLDVDDVLYGEQNNIPLAHTVVVQAGRKNRVVEGAAVPGGNSRVTMNVVIMIYNSTVGNEAAQRLITDQIAEAVETLLHEDTTMGGLLIHGFVEVMDPGITYRAGSQFRTTQMTYVGQSKVRITQ